MEFRSVTVSKLEWVAFPYPAATSGDALVVRSVFKQSKVNVSVPIPPSKLWMEVKNWLVTVSLPAAQSMVMGEVNPDVAMLKVSLDAPP